MKKIGFAAILAASTALVAVDANAAFLNGTVSGGGSLVNASLGNNPIVSALVNFDAVNTAIGLTSTNDFLAALVASGNFQDLSLGIPPFGAQTGLTSGVFTWIINSASAVPGPAATCVGPQGAQICSDSITFSVSGSVDDGDAVDVTGFIGSISYNGSCIDTTVNEFSTCDANSSSGSFSFSFTSAGNPPAPPPPPPPSDVPVPATLALLGAGLVGLGVSRRRRA